MNWGRAWEHCDLAETITGLSALLRFPAPSPSASASGRPSDSGPGAWRPPWTTTWPISSCRSWPWRGRRPRSRVPRSRLHLRTVAWVVEQPLPARSRRTKVLRRASGSRHPPPDGLPRRWPRSRVPSERVQQDLQELTSSARASEAHSRKRSQGLEDPEGAKGQKTDVAKAGLMVWYRHSQSAGLETGTLVTKTGLRKVSGDPAPRRDGSLSGGSPAGRGGGIRRKVPRRR
jgi:hypothetical protein